MSPRFFTSKVGIFLLAVIIISLVFGTVTAVTYNGMATKQATYQAQWAQVENEYQRKIDLIPQLVAQASGYSVFEKNTLENITRLRTQWLNSSNQIVQLNTTTAIDQNMIKLIATYEAYPDLFTGTLVQSLMFSIQGAENRIAYQRLVYNDDVRAYNTQLTTFPGTLYAGLFGFRQAQYYNPIPSIPGGP